MKNLVVVYEKGRTLNPDKTNVWWKVDKYFIHQDNIHSISRRGRGSVIRMYQGEDVKVNIDFDKLSVLFPESGKI